MDRQAVDVQVRTLLSVLSQYRFRTQSESVLQKDIEAVLMKHQVAFEREYRFSRSDIIDFFVDGRIGVECKIRGQVKKSIYRQLKRYAQFGDLESIILVTNIAMTLPSEIDGKPACVLSLGQAWI